MTVLTIIGSKLYYILTSVNHLILSIMQPLLVNWPIFDLTSILET